MSYPAPGSPVPGPDPGAPDRNSLLTSAIILIVVGFVCGGMLPSIFGIIALVQMDSDPRSARTMNKVGWIVVAVMVGLAVLAFLLWLVFAVFIFGSVMVGA